LSTHDTDGFSQCTQGANPLGGRAAGGEAGDTAFDPLSGRSDPTCIRIDGAVDHANQLLRLVVADNGPGVDPAIREKVFQPFFTTKERGTGLGLSLVQKIVVTHNGRLTLASPEPGGAAFQMALPLSRTS
jgi:signal transduction histidine kinase